MKKYSEIALSSFLDKNYGMHIIPAIGKNELLTMEGVYSINHKADFNDAPVINDSYNLRIVLPSKYPKELPIINELDGKIPFSEENSYHIHPHDRSFCLGSTLRLTFSCCSNPSLLIFSEKFLDPYLYAVSYKLKHGGSFIFGELEHGVDGLVSDYRRIFNLKTDKEVIQTLYLLGMRRRDANKGNCPCGCGFRLGKCHFRFVLNNYRKLLNRRWLKQHYLYLCNNIFAKNSFSH